MAIVLAIVGSRGFADYDLLCKFLDGYSELGVEIGGIVSGGAMGADTLAKSYALERNIPFLEIKPEWDKYGKAAGMIRNKDIVESADEVLAFWDGKSKGTLNSIEYSRKTNKPLVVCKYEDL